MDLVFKICANEYVQKSCESTALEICTRASFLAYIYAPVPLLHTAHALQHSPLSTPHALQHSPLDERCVQKSSTELEIRVVSPLD